MSRMPWRHNARGEWYVAVQSVIMALALFGPRTWPGLPEWPAPLIRPASIAGGVLLAGGGLLSLAGVLRLGTNLTVVPFPKDNAVLVDTGPYRLVRHPIYSGLIAAAFGWALIRHGWLAVGYAVLLFVFFDIKSRREELWLAKKFAAYPDYQKRVRKLIPFVY